MMLNSKHSINVSNSCCYCFTVTIIVVITLFPEAEYGLHLFICVMLVFASPRFRFSNVKYHLPPWWLGGLNEIIFIKYLVQWLAHSNCFYRWTQLMSHSLISQNYSISLIRFFRYVEGVFLCVQGYPRRLKDFPQLMFCNWHV